MMVMPFCSATWRISRARWHQGSESVFLKYHVPMEGQTYSFRYTLSNDSNGLDLGVLHQLHGGAVDTSGGSKVDDNVDILVLGHGLAYVLVDGEQCLAGSPVHLADELATESIDDTRHGGGLTLANEVEIQHALDGSGLHSVDEASGLVVEKSVFSTWAQRSAGSLETSNVVICREVALRGSAIRGCGRHGGIGERKGLSELCLGEYNHRLRAG